jgi:hypothetical protein
MRCDTCLHWEPSKHNRDFLPEDYVGSCSDRLGSKVDIIVKAGWEGGYVSGVETGCDFFCANWKDKT